MTGGNASSKHVVVVGAGPGGLSAAMILARRGFKVTVFEKQDQVGGRNATLKLGDYLFDTGPTFLMMKFILDEVFEEADRKSDDYLDFLRLEPMYRLLFEDFHMEPTTDREDMKRQIKEHFPGNEDNLDRFLEKEKRRFDLMLPCLQKPYSTFGSMFSRELRRALPYLSLGRSVFGVMGDYWDDDRLKLTFTFQTKYLGMSAWDCPAAFAILSYIEHGYGIYHIMGGLSEISIQAATVVEEHGGQIRLETPVRRIIVENGAARGVELEDGEKIEADDVIINADFAHAMAALFDGGVLRKYSKSRLDKMKYSCSTFMLYLGLDKLYDDMPHHTIAFARDYRRNVEDIFHKQRLSEDNSFYVRNASVSDPRLAPEGHSAVYVLVPVPNTKSGIEWSREQARFRKLILDTIKNRTTMKDLDEHIKEERVITPDDWVGDFDVYNGATFNLSHNIGQMLYFRPRNKFEEVDRVYLTGGGTHPGSGIPTILESGRIAANMISRFHNVQFMSRNLMT